ncbi:hypothetical protein HAHE_22170 [Haloferula helveola]|uniref:Glycosyl transferase family 1 domain-containing protein n=2 Tax=Haloferula helveola TaxID=490095 RepID=A0ABN6H737_9BACT|nr:hypothetical protein HAHE_22170 [Haloferula helveola]
MYFPARRQMRLIYHSRLDDESQPEYGCRQDTILCVATIVRHKGQHVLLDAFSKIAERVPTWNLEFVGRIADRAYGDQLLTAITERGLVARVRIAGAKTDPSSDFRAAAIYVQPSLREGLGLSLQEAMFYGCACVGTEVGGIPELLDHPSVGRVFQAGDTAQLAELLESLCINSAERAQLGSRARLSVVEKGMTVQRMIGTYDRLYREILGVP